MMFMSLLSLLRALALCKIFSLRAVTLLSNPFDPERSVNDVQVVVEFISQLSRYASSSAAGLLY